ncbi:hypothetical protein FRC09_009400, partial [Ceratobasidium sp. 395]
GGWEARPDSSEGDRLAAEGISMNNVIETPGPAAGSLTLAQSLEEATERATKIRPHPWQVQVSCEVCRGKRDILVHTEMSRDEKSLLLVMACFLRPETIVWLASPLDCLDQGLVDLFSGWGLKAIVIDSLKSNSSVYTDIAKGKYQVILASIEKMTESSRLHSAMKSASLTDRPQLLIVDEAHYISSWTESGFRPLYAIIGGLRRLLPPGTPVLAVTPTADDNVRCVIQNLLDFRKNPLVINLGNYRANLIHIVHHLQSGTEAAIGEIIQYLPSKTDLPLTLVFIDSVSLAFSVLDMLRKWCNPSVRGKIHLCHSLLSDHYMRVMAHGFGREIFRVLICVGSPPMRAAFQNVSLVINFLAPSSLSAWLRRAWYGTRSQGVMCRVVLMIQPPLFENWLGDAQDTERLESNDGTKQVLGDEQSTHNAETDAEAENGSESEDSDEFFGDTTLTTPKQGGQIGKQEITCTKLLFKYIRHTGCRNAFLDHEYGNPSRSEQCVTCDNCINKSRHPAHTILPIRMDPLFGAESSSKPTKPKHPVWLRAAERKSREEELRKWRQAKWESPECAELNAMESFILPDNMLIAIAKHPNLKALEDFETTTVVWPHYERWGNEVLEILLKEREKRGTVQASDRLGDSEPSLNEA